MPRESLDFLGPLQSEVSNLIQAGLDSLQPLADRIPHITTYMQTCLIVGIALATLSTLLFFVSVVGRLFCLTRILLQLNLVPRVIVHLALGLLCCLPFLVLVVILHIFQTKTKSLPSWIDVQQGQLGGLSVGTLCCAIEISTVSIIAPMFI